MHDGKDGKFSSLAGSPFETFHKRKVIFDEQYDGGDDDYKAAPGKVLRSEPSTANEQAREEREAFKKQFAEQVQS